MEKAYINLKQWLLSNPVMFIINDKNCVNSVNKLGHKL